MNEDALWEKFAGQSNYGKTIDVLGELVPRRSRRKSALYGTRAHVPMVGVDLCVGSAQGSSDVSRRQSGQFQIVREPGLVRIGIWDIRKEADSQPFRAGLVRFVGATELKTICAEPMDGYMLEITEEGVQTLTGLANGSDAVIPGATSEDADTFALACLGVLEARLLNTHPISA